MFDVQILGAGIAGCACALECAQAGMRVGIIEPDVPGGGATAAGMGHIVVMDDSPAQLALTQYSRSIWLTLQPHLPASTEYESRGTIWVAADDEEMAEVHAKQKTYSSIGVNSTVLDEKTLLETEPNLRKGLAGGLLVPDDGVLYPPCAAAYFLTQARSLGAVLLRGYHAVSAGKSEVRLSSGDIVRGDRIIVATGANSGIMPSLPIQKRKGHLVITDRYPGFLNHQLVELGYLKSAHSITTDSVAFNIQPRRTGQLLIGSSRQYGSEHPPAEHAMVEAMLARACAYMPLLQQLSCIRVWTGFRAATPDKLPLIGPTEDPTVFLAMGFEGLGITNAPGAARLLTDLLLHRNPAIDPTPYLPSRSSLAEHTHA